jgi:hypothetical protein
MPAARGPITEDAKANVDVRDRIGVSDPEVMKEAMQQLTWLGADPDMMMQAMSNAEQIVRSYPENDYA